VDSYVIWLSNTISCFVFFVSKLTLSASKSIRISYNLGEIVIKKDEY
jgi:hypothetical protein